MSKRGLDYEDQLSQPRETDENSLVGPPLVTDLSMELETTQSYIASGNPGKSTDVNSAAQSCLASYAKTCDNS